jgi:hypothetical protein
MANSISPRAKIIFFHFVMSFLLSTAPMLFDQREVNLGRLMLSRSPNLVKSLAYLACDLAGSPLKRRYDAKSRLAFQIQKRSRLRWHHGKKPPARPANLFRVGFPRGGR